MDAARNAVRGMIELLGKLHAISAEDAYMLCSVCGDLRISEIVEPTELGGFVLPSSNHIRVNLPTSDCIFESATVMTGLRRRPRRDLRGRAALFVVNTLPALVNVIANGLKWDDRALGLLASAERRRHHLGFADRSARCPALFSSRGRRGGRYGTDHLRHRLRPEQCRIADGLLSICRRLASGLCLAACYAIYSAANPQRNYAAFPLPKQSPDSSAVRRCRYWL